MMMLRLLLVGSLLAVMAVALCAAIEHEDMPDYFPPNDVLDRCCKPHKQSYGEKELLQCTTQVVTDTAASASKHTSKQVAFVTYATENIRDYAAYSLSINAAYCETHKYEFRMLSPESGAEHDKRDQRWNKVRILLDALEGWASDREFVIWLDADLVVLDHSFRIDKLLAQARADQDILVCQDPEPAEIFSIVNTGAVIVRNTQWSREFLKRWWGQLSDRTGWDQHVFTTLYQESAEVREKVHLLEADAFNTRRPATLHHHSRCPALHMVGAVLAHRQAVFQTAWNALCEGHDMQLYPQSQLGLDKQNLARLEKQVLQTRQARAEDLVNTITGTPPDQLATYEHFKQLQIAEQMGVVMKLGEPTKGAPADVSMVQQAMKHYYKLLKHLVASVTLDAGKCHDHEDEEEVEEIMEVVEGDCDYSNWKAEELLQNLIDIAFELALPPAKPFYKKQLMQEIAPYIEQLLVGQNPNSNSREVHYLEFKRRQFLAQTFHTDDPSNNADRAKEVAELQGAISMWDFMYGLNHGDDEASLQEMKKSRGSGGHWEEGADVMDTIGILYCITGDHSKGLSAAARGAAIIERHWDLENALHFSRHDMIPGSVRGWDQEIMGYLETVPAATLLGLAQTYKNMAYCAYQSAQTIDINDGDGEPLRKDALMYAEYAALIRLDIQILALKSDARKKKAAEKSSKTQVKPDAEALPLHYDDSVSSQRALQQHEMDKKQREENSEKITELMTIVNSLTSQSPVQARYKLLEREKAQELSAAKAAKEKKTINRRKKSSPSSSHASRDKDQGSKEEL